MQKDARHKQCKKKKNELISPVLP